jgi:hypothetical protein
MTARDTARDTARNTARDASRNAARDAAPPAAPLISVILPVYNGEGSLAACLDALLAQDGVRLQIVAVDDGSTDASGHILDSYAARHPGVVAVHTANQGIGMARVEGLARATGGYIGFCDSDDRPDADMYATMLKRALETSADLVVCGFRRVDAESGQALTDEMLGFGPQPRSVAADPGILLAINTSVWNKLYKAELIDSSILAFAFPRVAEDVVFQLLAYQRVKRITFVERPLYCYRVRAGSLMSGMTQASFDCLHASLLELRRLMADAAHGRDMLEVCDLVAFTHLGLSLPLRLTAANGTAAQAPSLSQVARHARAVLKKDFPLFATSRLCSLASVLQHRGRNLKLFVARLCHRLHLTTALIGLLRLCLRHNWRVGYW